MVIVGIDGNPGAGKTTFSKMLFVNESGVRIIQIDHALDKLRKIIPSKSNEHFFRDGDKIEYLNNKSLIYKVVHSKLVSKFYENFIDYYIKNEMIKSIDSAHKDGVKYLVIEGARLDYRCDINIFDYLILIKADYDERCRRVLVRDQGAKYGALKFVETTMVNETYDYDFIINNMGSKEEFASQAEWVSDEIKKHKTLVRIRKKQKNM